MSSKLQFAPSLLFETDDFSRNIVLASSIPFGLLISTYLYGKYQSYQQRQIIWQQLIRKQEDVAKNKSHFQTKYSHVTARQAEIVSLGYNELREDLQNGTLSAVEVVEAFLAKAVEVDQKTNAVTEFLEDALERAEQLDRVDPGERGPMHGIPISVKEHIHLSGLDCTVGIPGNLRHPPPKSDANLVKVLKDLGAVPFCRTNLSQTLCSYECSNPIFGVTTNFRNQERSPGGSSGGEGALIAGGGSILGIGSDLGGSVRIPAISSGVTSLKPTSGRVPLTGQGSDGGHVGVVGLYNTLGFMARTAEALEDCMSKVCSHQALERMKVDARLVPLPWKEGKAKQGQKLRIGWYDFDGLTEPTPGCRRAVKKAKHFLESQGHTLVEFTPPNLDQAFKLCFSFGDADNGLTMLNRLKHGPVDQLSIGSYYRTMVRDNSIPVQLISWIRRRLGLAAHLFGRESVELWELNAKRLAVVEKILKAWNEQDLDVLIAPGMAVPALRLGYAKDLTPAITYTFVYNMLNFPAGSIPICNETTADQEALESSFAGYERSKTYGLMKEGSRGALGMSLNVQVIGRPWSEELVLRVMREIEDRRSNEKHIDE